MLNSCSNSSNLRLVGDPVDVVTGAVSDLRTDFRRRGPIPINWFRYYASNQVDVVGCTGHGFQHEYERWLERDLDGILYRTPEAGGIPFQDIEIGKYERSSGFLLYRQSKSTYSIDAADGLRYYFEFQDGRSRGALTRIEDAEEHHVDFHYDQNGRLASITDSLRRTIAVNWSNRGKLESLVLLNLRDGSNETTLVRYEYDSDGNAVRVTDQYDTVQLFEFDSNHRVIKRTDRLGYSFLFTFDSQGRCVHARGEDNYMGIQLEYHPEARTTYVQRADGGRWGYFYSVAGAITQINDPYGNATRYIVDSQGRTESEIDPLGNETRWHYNGFGELAYRTDSMGNVLPAVPESAEPPLVHGYVLPETSLQWEFGGLLTQEAIEPVAVDNAFLQQLPATVVNACLGIHSPTTADAASADPTEDDYDRPTDGADGIERWKYDAGGNEIEHCDRDGVITRRTYASAGLPREEIDPLGRVTRFGQTFQGLATRVEDPGGTVTEYLYDLCDRLVELRQNGQLVERYSRDAAGNIIAKFDRLGNKAIEWSYGPGNFFTERVLNSGERQEFKYDDQGRISAAKTAAGDMSLAYAEDDTVVVDLRDGSGVEHALSSSEAYQTIYLGNFIVDYHRNAEGDWIVKDPTGAEHNFQTRDAGFVLKRLANGHREIAQYDAEGRCLRKASFRSGDSTAWMRKFKYSLEGDLVTCEDSARGRTSVRYDQSHQLSQVTTPQGSTEYAYDVAGNLNRQGERRASYGACNRLVAFEGDRFEYDECDRISSSTGSNKKHSYRYNELGFLTDADIDGQPWKATYDAFGRRTSKTWQGQTTEYYWDDLRLSAEVRQDGRVRLYIYADRAALVPFMLVDYASADNDPSTGEITYLVTDHLGSPIQAISADGKVRWTGESSPFGTVNTKSVDGFELALRFPGHYADNETGLHYNRFRYYSPELGRYLQPDPLGQLGGINLYANPARPYTSVDIDGLMAKAGGKGTGAKGNKAKTAPQKGSPPAGGKRSGCKSSKSKIKTPDEAAKKAVQGEYVNPLTGETKKTSKTLAADHIYPKKLIQGLPGFDKLTPKQQAAVLNNLENFQGLPTSLNSSKGSKTDWDTYKGKPLDEQYAKDLAKRQQKLKRKLQKQIDSFKK